MMAVVWLFIVWLITLTLMVNGELIKHGFIWFIVVTLVMVVVVMLPYVG